MKANLFLHDELRNTSLCLGQHLGLCCLWVEMSIDGNNKDDDDNESIKAHNHCPFY
jgi:hypothetical protein